MDEFFHRGNMCLQNKMMKSPKRKIPKERYQFQTRCFSPTKKRMASLLKKIQVVLEGYFLNMYIYILSLSVYRLYRPYILRYTYLFLFVYVGHSGSTSLPSRVPILVGQLHPRPNVEKASC